MQDDHDDFQILLEASGMFVQVRRGTLVARPRCPLCDEEMYKLRRPPIKPINGPHALWLWNRMEFYACPDRDQPGHRAAERIYRNSIEFWSRPLEKLLSLTAKNFARTRSDDRVSGAL